MFCQNQGTRRIDDDDSPPSISYATRPNTKGSARTVELPINHDKFVKMGLIEHGEPSKFTRSQVYAGLDLVYANCRADGPLACASLPEKANKAGHTRALGMGYTYGKGGVKHANLMLYGLGKHRRPQLPTTASSTLTRNSLVRLLAEMFTAPTGGRLTRTSALQQSNSVE